jgi:hypothetical protein
MGPCDDDLGAHDIDDEVRCEDADVPGYPPVITTDKIASWGQP